MENIILEGVTFKLIEGAASDVEKVKRIFYFVRDEIKFDMVIKQFMSAEEVLIEKRGSCMNKAVLLHDMVKIAGVEARLHFMEVKKTALEDLLHPAADILWPKTFLHTYPEVKLNGEWVPMEATFDKELHEKLLKKNLNFAKYNEFRNISIEFDEEGVHGAQQYAVVEGSKPIYDSILEPLKKYFNDMPEWIIDIQPFLFEISSKWINEKVRK